MNILKQSTVISVKLGPFLDDTNGTSAETGLTIPQSAVRLTKNGGDFAQKNSGTSAAHDEFGWYDVPLNGTDTNTVGRLGIAIHGTGALPVWKDFQVVEEDTYEFLFASGATVDADVAAILADTNELQIDDYPARFTTVDSYVQAILADTGTAGVQIASAQTVATVTTLTGHTPQTGDSFARLGAPAGVSISADIAAIEAQTDDIGAAGAGLTAVPWNASWDAEVQSEVDDALIAQRLDELVNADSDIDGATPPTVGSVIHELLTKTTGSFTYDQTTDSLEAIRDNQAGADTAAIADAVWDEAFGDHSVGTSFGGLVATIEGQTDDIGAAGVGLTEAGGTGDQLTAVPWNASWDAEVQSEATDALNAYDPPTQAELVSEINDVQTDIAALNDPTAATIADAVWNEAKADHTVGTSFGDLAVDLDAVLTDTADMQPKLGTPAGASVSADIAAIEAQTDDIGIAGAGLTAVPWNAAWDAEVESEVDDALGAGTGTALTAIPWNASWDTEVESEALDALNTILADSIPADGTIPTLRQALYMLTQFMMERSVSGTTVTVKKVDGSTSLLTLTLDNGTDPTSITRAT